MINIPFIIKKKNPESEISENIDPEIKRKIQILQVGNIFVMVII